MKKFATAFCILFVAASAHSQQLSQVSFSNGTTLTYYSFLVDNDVLIRVSEDGKILEWGEEVLSDRLYNYYAPKLQPYMGRIEYYGAESDSIFKGKVKSIGTAYITYYNSYEPAEKAGKLKTIGPLTMDYYSNYEDKMLRGKLKMIGDLSLDHYSSIENEAYRGKLKAIGNTQIVYYSVFDDKAIAGKIKSIGGTSILWYGTFDRPELKRALKSNNYRPVVGAITYILR